MNEFIVWGEEKIWHKFIDCYVKANNIVNVDMLRKKYDFDRVYYLNKRLYDRYFKRWDNENIGKPERTTIMRFSSECAVRCNGELQGINNFKPISAHKLVRIDDTPQKNKIYADCSIVEFDIELSHKEEKLKGIVTFSYDDMCYGIKSNLGNFYEFTHYEISNLKVIGTIQENQELLKDNR